jgi:acetate kinase
MQTLPFSSNFTRAITVRSNHSLIHEHATFQCASALSAARKTSISSRIISVHIDDSVSVAAFDRGRMTFTTELCGFGVPGLHSAGSIDPAVVYDVAYHGARPSYFEKNSGLSAMTGLADYDAILANAKKLDKIPSEKGKESIIALMMLVDRVAYAIAGAITTLRGADVVLFSGRGALLSICREICDKISYLGVAVSSSSSKIAVNSMKSGVQFVQTPRSKVKVGLVRADTWGGMLLQADALSR